MLFTCVPFRLLYRPNGRRNYMSGWRKCGAFDIIYGLLNAAGFINYDRDEEQNTDDDFNLLKPTGYLIQ